MTINLINNKKYIGIDSHNNPKYLGSGKIIKKAIKKYGTNNFLKIILEECNSKEELSKKEKYWIKFFNASNDKNFYNILSGGQGCSKTEENPMFNTNLYNIWKEKYGEGEAINRMQDLSQKRSNFSSGKNNSMYGKRSPRAKFIGKFDKSEKLLDVFKTVREASKKCHHKRISIAKWRKLKSPNYLGHIWKFISKEEYDNFIMKNNETD